MKKKLRIVMTLVIPLALVAISVCMLLLFSSQAAKRTRELTYTILKAAGTEQRDLLNVKIEGDFSTLTALAGVAASSDATHYDILIEHMRAALTSSGFKDFFIADADGNGVSSDGREVSVGDRLYYQQAIAGKRALARVSDCRIGAEPYAFVLAVPVAEGDVDAGAIIGILDETSVLELLRINIYSGSRSFVCDAAGALIVGEEIEALPTGDSGMEGVFEHAVFDKGYFADNAAADFRSGTEGFVSYILEGKHWYLAYTPLGENDWMICTVIPGDVVDEALNAELKDGYLLTAVAAASALLLILFVVALYARANLQTQREQEQLRIAEEEYRLSAQQSGAMIIRYDLEADLLMPNETATEHFKLPEKATNFDYTFALDALVAEESRTDYQAFWAAIRAGEQTGGAEVRMANASGALRWYTFAFTAICGSLGQSVQAIVTIRDVTVQREKLMEYERWRRMASSLTGTSAAYIEFNLITGAVERIEGEFVQNGEKNAEILLRDFEQTRVQPADRRKFHMFVSMERLRFMSKDSVLRDECTVHTIQPDGSVRECTISLRMTETDDGKDAKAIVAITDLGDSRRGMERLSELAFQDGLSGLLNRTAARAAIEETLRSGGNETVALFMLDIDNFKLVNDLMGHRQGDRALVQISDAMRGVFRTTDIVARIGGDEFFVFLTDVSLPGLVEAKASALCNALNFTYSNGIRSVAVSASIGIVVARRDQVDYEALYTEADLALYEAKNTGKNRYRIHYVTKKSELGAHSEVGTAYSVQIYSLLKYMDGGVALLEAGETTRLLFASGGGLHREDRPVWDEKDVHPEDKDALLSKMQACAADGTAFESAYRFLLTGGSYGWRHIRAEKIPSAEGSPVRLVSVITDITDLKRSSLGLKSIVASAPIGIAIVRFGERLETTFYNDALLSILGVTFDQYRLISHDFSALLLNNELAAVREAVARSMNHKEPLKTSFCALDEEGRHTRRVFVRGVLIDMLNGVPSYLLVMSEQNPSERGR